MKKFIYALIFLAASLGFSQSGPQSGVVSYVTGPSLPSICIPTPVIHYYVFSGGTYTPYYCSATNTWTPATATGTTNIGTFLDKGGQVFNVKSYGAAGDEVFYSTASMTAGSGTVTLSSGTFSSSQNGKTMTINAGTAGVNGTSNGTINYVSGGTATGNANGASWCNVSFIGGGGTGATAWILLSNAGSLSGGQQVWITNPGTGYTSAPTTGTLSNGGSGGVCSGTATFSNVTLYYQPITGTFTYVSPTSGTLSVNAVNTVSNAQAALGTDDSTAVINTIAAATAAGGGIVYFPQSAYLILSQIVIPSNVGVSLTLQGAGSMWDLYGPPTVRAATILDLRYSGGGAAKIDTTSFGSLTIEDISLEDHGYDSVPFLHTSNTTIFPRKSSFVGSGIGNSASQNDGIVLGAQTTGTGAFQGYGTVIGPNLFSRIRRGVIGNTYTNAVVIRDNSWAVDSGGDTALLLDGTVGEVNANVITGNLIEIYHYQTGFTYTNAVQNWGSLNTFWDSSANIVTLNGTSTGNVCMMCGGSTNYQMLDNGSNGYTIFGATNGQPYFQGPLQFNGTTYLPTFNQGLVVPQRSVYFGLTTNQPWAMNQIGTGSAATWDLVHQGVADSLEIDATGNAVFQSNLTSLGNLSSGNGTNVVYRCATAGTLPAGALTITAGSCGTTTDTGLRVK